MSIRRDLLLRSALLRLPDLSALSAAAPAAQRTAAAGARGGAAPGQPARTVRAGRRPPSRKAAAGTA